MFKLNTLQIRCQHLLDQSPINQSKLLAITNAAMSLMLPKGMKLLNRSKPRIK